GLKDREVAVVETRATDDIAAQVPKVEDTTRRDGQYEDRPGRAGADPRIANGIVEPLVRIAQDLRGSEHVRPQESSRQGRDISSHVNRVAALQLRDRRELPAFDEAVAPEGQLINPVDDEAVARVEVR